MKKPSKVLTMLGVAAALGLLAGCGSKGGAEMQKVPDTPQGNAYLFRNGLMEVMAYKLEPLGKMARGSMPVDEKEFVQYANDLNTASQWILEGFMPEGAIPQSRALPAIWKNYDDFKMKAMAMQDAVKKVADAANSGGFKAAQPLVGAVGMACGGCHRAYRKRTGS